jgi:integrase/recombinase XerD
VVVAGALRLVEDPERDDNRQPPELDLIEEWRQYLTARGFSPATRKIYTQTITSLQRHAEVSGPLQLTRLHVIPWLARDVSPWTRLTYWKVIERWSEWLREFGHDPNSDLTRGLKKPRRPSPVARPVSDEVIERLLALKLVPRAHAYVRLALFEALRVHEIAKLRTQDFDFESGWLMVVGKGGHPAQVPIHPEIAKLGPSMPAWGWWFPESLSDTGHVDPKQVSMTITNALRAVGCNATAHQLRDTCATRIQRQQGDIRVTQSMLRHRDISSTMKYTAVANTDLQKAVRTLDWGSEPGPVEIRQALTGLDLSKLDTDQLRDLAAQLVAALQARTE